MSEPKMTHESVFLERLSKIIEIGLSRFQVLERPASGQVDIEPIVPPELKLSQIMAIADVLGTRDISVWVERDSDGDPVLSLTASKVAYPTDGGCGCWWCANHAKSRTTTLREFAPGVFTGEGYKEAMEKYKRLSATIAPLVKR